MADRPKDRVKIQLTPEQRQQIKQALGKEVSEIEINPEDLEERVAPRFLRRAE